MQLEGRLPGELSAFVEGGHGLVEEAETLVEGLSEALFLALDHLPDEVGTLL